MNDHDMSHQPSSGLRRHRNNNQHMTKRALLIAFHFPPQAASSGIQRTLSFSKHLGRHGWDPMVLSAHPRAYSQQNPSQLTSVPADLVVRRAFALDAKHHLGIKGRYPGVLAVPDRWTTWWLGAIPAGLSLIRRYKPQLIWSTFPISTAHLIALTLHRLTGLPWVADFRDPMLQPTYPASPLQRRVYGWIERQAITRCQAAVFTTFSAMETYRQRFPHIATDKFHVVENGYDEDGFGPQLPAQAPGSSVSQRLVLVHSGVLYRDGRDPSPFLRAVADLKLRGLADATSLRIVLRAPGDLAAVSSMVDQADVADIVEVAPPVPYRLALEEMLMADGLMVFQGTLFNTQIPAKIYEYFRARKPILGLVDPVGETARVLGRAGFDDLADADSAEAIAPILARFIDKVRNGQAPVASEALIQSSSRQYRASELAAVFDAVAR